MVMSHCRMALPWTQNKSQHFKMEFLTRLCLDWSKWKTSKRFIPVWQHGALCQLRYNMLGETQSSSHYWYEFRNLLVSDAMSWCQPLICTKCETSVCEKLHRDFIYSIYRQTNNRTFFQFFFFLNKKQHQQRSTPSQTNYPHWQHKTYSEVGFERFETVLWDVTTPRC